MIKKLIYIALMTSFMSSLSFAGQPHVMTEDDVKSITSFLTAGTGLNIGSSFNTDPYEETGKLGFFTFTPQRELYPFNHYEIAVTPISKKLYTVFMTGKSVACASDTANVKKFLGTRFSSQSEGYINANPQSNLMYTFKDTVDTQNILLYSCDLITNDMYLYYYREDLAEVFNNEVNDWYAKQLNSPK